MPTILVAKADGTTEPFDPLKLRTSLHKAGADEEATVHIVEKVQSELYDGIPTEKIYHHAFALLREHRREAAAHYSLKRALLEFGPTGFPFETFLGELFRAEGYEHVKTDQIVQGGCVEHEVDVVMEKDGINYFVEAKFHNTAALKSDLKVALYVKARIDDIRNAKPHETVAGLIVTNTKFTGRAIEYASCQGLELLGWDYPNKSNLHSRIETHRMYPTTALTTLTKHEKIALLSQKLVLCRDLLGHPDILEGVGIAGKRVEDVLHEAAALCARTPLSMIKP